MSTSNKKDMRRADLVIPFIEPEKDDKKDATDMGSTIASTMPMMAVFTRNKMVGWVAVVFALQQWLQETPETRKNASTPGYFSVGMSFLGLATSYMELFLPPSGQKVGSGSGTEARAPVPQ